MGISLFFGWPAAPDLFEKWFYDHSIASSLIILFFGWPAAPDLYVFCVPVGFRLLFTVFYGAWVLFGFFVAWRGLWATKKATLGGFSMLLLNV